MTSKLWWAYPHQKDIFGPHLVEKWH